MEDLLANQNQIMGAINQLLINFKKDGADRKTVPYIKKRLDTLDAYWQEFQLNHSQILNYEDQSHAYFVENWYLKTSTFYTETRTYIQTYLTLEPRKDDRPLIKPATPLLLHRTTDQSDLRSPLPEDAGKGTPRPIHDNKSFEFPSVSGSSHPPHKRSNFNNSKLDEMLRKQRSNFKAFGRITSSIDLSGVTEKWEFEDILKTLNSRWSAIDDLHWEIDSELYEENVEYDQTYNTYEQKYNHLKKEINSKMWSACHREKSTPQMDIPTFTGNYHQWVSFKDLYCEAVHINRSLSNAQKMQFLKSKLRGEPEKIVQHLHISSDNYNVCWDLLNHRYNNSKLIFGSHINILLNLPSSQQQSAVHIKKIHDSANESLNAIKNLGVDVSSWDPLIVHILSQKLDTDTHRDYVESLKNPRDLPTLSDFLNFLENKFTSLESSQRKQDATFKSSFNKSFQPEMQLNRNKTNNYFKSFTSKQNHFIGAKNTQTGCPLCKNEQHGIFHCNTFLKLQPTERRNTIAKLKLCVNCLYDHNGKNCISEKRCRECQGRHNTLVHEAYVKQPTMGMERNKATNVSQNDITETLLATAVVRVQSSDGTFIKLRALIDQGSQTSLITEKAAQMLQLPRQRCKGVIFGVGAKENNCKGVINITCSSVYSDYHFTTDIFIMKNLINNLPNRSFNKPDWSYLENVQLADPDFNVSRPVDLLLGADVYSSIILSGIISSDHKPVAQQTRLGWILCGNVKSYQCNVILNNTEDIQRFWEIEDIPEEHPMSQQDAQCLEYFKNTTSRQSDGKYVVRLPLLSDATERLGESKSKAIAQFKQLEKRFSKRKDIELEYKLFINEYIELGHMRLTSPSSLPTLGVFLPHHCVLRAESLTTALRVVFNASAKTSSGQSLNDVMLRGPNLQQDLLSLIIKWRQYQYAYTADIEKMFRQILLHDDDQKYQKIIWRDIPNNNIQEYQLATVTYGTKAAPFLAMMVLKQLADDEGHKFPSSPAAKVLQEQFYMDDLISGSYDLPSAKQLQSDLISLLKAGGFNLRKWSANTPALLEGVSTSKSSDDQSYDFKESTKTLGLRWHPQSDEFSLDIKINLSHTKLTKRNLLSDISKLFDPSGWLTPVTTKLKLLFQKVWSHNVAWDDDLPTDIKEEWLKIRSDITNITRIRIPRWLNINKDDVIELHGFCDASTNAYGCVIYCKINKQNQDGSNNNTVVLVAAKSRLVPPNKNITLPRLELCATHLLSKLMQKVKNCLKGYETKTFGWCDSTAVLGWLNGEPTRWKPFVANRVIQVTAVLPAKCWHYVKSQDNPADCASRGITTEQLHQHPLWWHGPAWLSEFDDDNVKERPVYVTDEEIKITKQVNVTACSSDDDIISNLLNKYSSFTRVTRIIAYILRIKQKSKQNYLSATELQKAKLKIIKHIQNREFTEDIQHLQKFSKASSKSKILSLNPYIDSEGLLRVGGRLSNASISKHMMHPLIIPHESQLTNLLIDHAHKSTFHGGARVTLAWLRQQFWILGGNRAIKRRLRLCVTCRRHNPSKQHQMMGDLPESRSTPSKPFYHTGVDFTGYVDVKASKGRGIKTFKGYISVFVCMVTKAVHLELVSDLTSSAFLAALRRMAARRGTPGHIYSDNGTNFVGANKIINQETIELKSVISDEFLSDISEMNITWHFNAPSWPSAGGLWEAAVKSLKYHLRRVIGEQKLTFEEFSTLLTQLEACLNSRPLCAITEDPDDINYLTPSHFLSSGPLLSIIETERDERTRWCLTQKIFADIWKRWKSEYLTQLSARSKWQQSNSNIKLEDIVIIHDANLPAGKWALARVIDLHPGKDGLVRVVTVKTKNGVIKRPITKLTVLPVDSKADYQPVSHTNRQQPSAAGSNQTQVKQKTRTSGIKFSNIIMFTLLLLTTFLQVAQGAYNITPFKDTQGFYFDKTSSMRLIRDEWKMIVYYDMEPYWQGSSLLNKYITHLEIICAKLQERQQCDVILLQLRHGSIELHYYDQLLLGQQSAAAAAKIRVRRGLINGIGSVARTLFGVLDDDFAIQYQKDIDLIRHNQQHLVKLWKNQTSVIEAQYSFLKRLDNTINQQHKLFNQHLNKLDQQNLMIKEEVERLKATNEFILSSVIANNILASLKTIQNTLLDTVTDIYHGKFDIHILSPDQLKDELSIISSHLSKEISLPIDDIHSGVSKLYHLLRVKVKVTKQYLLFEIKIPLLTRESYDIYKIIPIPQLVNNNMINIIPISDYIAMNIQKDSYLSMTETDVQSCLHSDLTTKLCELRGPIYHLQTDQNLCIKNDSTNRCQTIINMCKNSWNALETANTYMFYCCEQCTFRLMCGSQITTERVSKAGIVSIGDNCVLKGDSFMIHSHGLQVNTLHTQADLVAIDIPPINNMINLTVPIPKDEKNQTESRERQASLKEIGRQIDTIGKEDIESDLDQMSYHDVHHYVLIYVLVGACGAVGAAFLWRRARTRCLRLAPRAPPEPQPRAAPRLSLHDIASASAIASASESVNVNLNSIDHSARVQNKATSPIFTSVRLSDINH